MLPAAFFCLCWSFGTFRKRLPIACISNNAVVRRGLCYHYYDSSGGSEPEEKENLLFAPLSSDPIIGNRINKYRNKKNFPLALYFLHLRYNFPASSYFLQDCASLQQKYVWCALYVTDLLQHWSSSRLLFLVFRLRSEEEEEAARVMNTTWRFFSRITMINIHI